LSAIVDRARNSNTPSQELRGRLLILGATFFWGTSAALARLIFRDHDIPPLVMVELRLLMSLILLGGWLAWRRPEALAIAPRDLGPMLLLGSIGVAAIQGSYYHSISVLGVGLAILIQYLAPSLIVIFAIARGARPNVRTLAIVVAALAGTGLLVGYVGPEARSARLADWLISFSSALTFAFYILYSKRLLSRYPPETVLVYTFAVASAVWMVAAPPWQIVQAGYSPRMWGMFLVIGVASALIPFSLFYAGLRKLPPAEVGILATVEPAVAVVAAWLILGEGLQPLQWLGAGMVLAAAMLASTGTGLGLKRGSEPKPQSP